MKLLLIRPCTLEGFRKPLSLVNLTLPYLAGMLKNHDVTMVFERLTRIPWHDDFDAVLISANHPEARRANEIADDWRKKGVPVVMGGYYPSMSPDLALNHCDSVVIGEAEPVIAELLRDLERNSLKARYVSANNCDMRDLAAPRYDLLPKGATRRLSLWSIQVTRGCTRKCDFCCARRLYGRKFKKRPLNDVTRELKRLGKRHYYLVDDNPTLDTGYMKAFFRKAAPYVKSLFVNMDSSVEGDEQLLIRAKRGKVQNVFLGLERIERIGKAKEIGNRKAYERLLTQLRRHGILANVSIMVGWDDDSRESLQRIGDFLIRNAAPILFLFVVTPPPHSELYKRLDREGRMLWGRREYELAGLLGTRLAFEPKNWSSVAEFEKDYWELYERFYSWRSIVRRVVLRPYRSPVATIFVLWRNVRARKAVRQRLHPMMA